MSTPPSVIARSPRVAADAERYGAALGRSEPSRAARARVSKAMPGWFWPARDAVIAAVVLALAVLLGSGGLAHVDLALLGYLGATFLAFVATVHRASAFWRRPASAFYARELGAALLRPGSLRATLAHASRDLASQRFLRRRSVARWLAHMLLSFGTLASFAITVPLVFGWMHFVADGDAHYRVVLFTFPAIRFPVDGALAWIFFHGLSLAAVAVVLGATDFLVRRLRLRRLPGATSGFAIAPLLLLLAVAATGLALPATRGMAGVFPLVAALHEVAVVVLLVAIPFSKLGHVLIRPLQLGARAVRAASRPRVRCACGAMLAPARQAAAVAELLERRGLHFGEHAKQCPACRRRQVAVAQAGLVDAHFQPRLSGARPAPRRDERAA